MPRDILIALDAWRAEDEASNQCQWCSRSNTISATDQADFAHLANSLVTSMINGPFSRPWLAGEAAGTWLDLEYAVARKYSSRQLIYIFSQRSFVSYKRLCVVSEIPNAKWTLGGGTTPHGHARFRLGQAIEVVALLLAEVLWGLQLRCST
jgi:hypothetical protein